MTTQKIKKGSVVWFFGSMFKNKPPQIGIVEEISYNGRIATIRPGIGEKRDLVHRGVSTLKLSSREELDAERALAVIGNKVPQQKSVLYASSATLTIANLPPISLGASQLYLKGGN